MVTAAASLRAARGRALLGVLLLGSVLVLVGLVPGPGAAAAGPPASVPVAGAASPSDAFVHWSTFHGSENRSGYSNVNGPSVATTLWEFAPPGATAPPIRSSIVTDENEVYFSTNFGTVYAYNRTLNVSLDWRTVLGTTPTAGDVWDGELLLGTSGGAVVALSTQNGTQLWARYLGGAIQTGVSVANGTVFAGTTNGTITALNATTGGFLWQRSAGAPVVGALAIEGSTIVANTAVGKVVALTTSGAPLWNTTTGVAFDCGPAISDDHVIVADLAANVSALSLANGSIEWTFPVRSLAVGDAIEATPAVGLSRVFVSSDEGQIVALSESNGSLLWNRSTGFTGYSVLSSPALAPNGLYVADAMENVVDLSPSNGSYLWFVQSHYAPIYPSPAVEGGLVYLADDLGSVYAYGPPGGIANWPVNGTVTSVGGGPIAGATVSAGRASTTTTTDGTFTLPLPNGTFNVTVSALGFEPKSFTVVVAGPTGPFAWILFPVPTALVSGRVVDTFSDAPIANATVTFQGIYGSQASTITDGQGDFTLWAPVGLDYFTVGPPPGSPPFQGFQEHIVVPVAGLSGLVVRLAPASPPNDSTDLVLLAWAAVAAALVTIGAWEMSRRRVALGLSPDLLSPFAQYVAMRLIVLLAQAVAILAALYIFGTMLPAVSLKVSPCAFIDAGCQSGGWSNPANTLLAFIDGLGHFAYSLVTGDWGIASYGNLKQPAKLFLAWWGPNSVELALIALPIAAVIAYLTGLWAGSRPGGIFDTSARVISIGGLLVPSFLIVLLFLGAAYEPYLTRLGDTPYGFVPSADWFLHHGGFRSWIGNADQTTPTGFPLVDGAIHGDWAFEELVFFKTIWQALAIAVVYVAVFLRFVRHAVAEAFEEPHVVAARARGVSEPTILWRHTGRRVIPLLVLVFGITLPIYIGTQALVEAMANDNGIGTLLISEMTHVAGSGFGFHNVNPGQSTQGLYQVTIYLLVLLVLFGNLCTDILARYLDPRLLRSRR